MTYFFVLRFKRIPRTWHYAISYYEKLHISSDTRYYLIKVSELISNCMHATRDESLHKVLREPFRSRWLISE